MRNQLILTLGFMIVLVSVDGTQAQTKSSPESMEIQSFSPNIMVKNVQQTVNFYQNLLGFKLVTSVPDETGKQALQWAMVQADSVTLMFQEEANLKAEYPSLNQHTIGGGFTLYLTVTNLNALYERAKSVATIVKEPHKMFYGATEFAILDNNGYVLTLSEAAQ